MFENQINHKKSKLISEVPIFQYIAPPKIFKKTMQDIDLDFLTNIEQELGSQPLSQELKQMAKKETLR